MPRMLTTLFGRREAARHRLLVEDGRTGWPTTEFALERESSKVRFYSAMAQ